MNYTLNQLQIFLKIVQTQSVTKASEELSLTQPAVSIQLRNFQDQFEIPLTEVVGRKIFITDFGHEIAKSAENILNQVYEINYKTLAFKGQLIGRLKIAIVSTGKYIMPYFLSNFMNNNKGIELLMDVTNKNKVLENLTDNDVDFALVSILPNKINIEKLDLIQNKLYLVGSSKIKIDKDLSLFNVFKDLPLIYREEGSGTRQIMENFIEKNKIKVIKKMELTSNEAVKQALIAKMGFSIMPLIGIKNELINNELQIIQIDGLPIVTTWSLIWLKGKRLSPVSKSFIDYINLERSNIFKEHFSWYEHY